MINSIENCKIETEDDGIRLDRWFKRHYPNLTHSQLEKLIRTGQIRLDGKRIKSNTRVHKDQKLRVPPIQFLDTASKKIKSVAKVNDYDIELLRQAIIYKDKFIIAINKPAGLAVQGGSSTNRHIDAMLGGLKFEMIERPKLIHRLDKDTTGVLLLGRTSEATNYLSKAFKTRGVHKIYWAIVVGEPQQKHGKVDIRLQKRGGTHGEKMVPSKYGKRAVTFYRTIDQVKNLVTWLALMPKTGRTHQLRAHCAEIGIPILSDGKYGGNKSFLPNYGVKKLHLHAKAIKFPHPNGGYFQVVSELSPHMKKTWNSFGFDEKQVVDPFEDFYEQWYGEGVE